MSARIKNIKLSKKLHRLKKPYILSFATLEVFISIQIRLTDHRGNQRTAEVVPLLGYSEESESDIVDYLNAKIPLVEGLDFGQARSTVSKDIQKQPFATSPILTAIDLFDYPIGSVGFPPEKLVAPTSTKDKSDLLSAAQRCIDERLTLKVKLTGDPEEDINGLLSLKDHDLRYVRLDANQAYDLQDAQYLIGTLKEEGQADKYDYFEQPFSVHDWESHLILNQLYPEIPVMLDESIVTESDLDQAVENEIRFVKLKLFKQGGIMETVHLAKKAHENGVKVVLGNGVATALSNDIENHLFVSMSTLFYGASEANGYLKVST